MNGHSGPFVQWDDLGDNLLRVYNMLSGHAIVYLSSDWVEMARRCCYHAGYVIESYYDVQIAEVQRFFNIYACDDPMFYQTSSDGNQKVTYEQLSKQQSLECVQEFECIRKYLSDLIHKYEKTAKLCSTGKIGISRPHSSTGATGSNHVCPLIPPQIACPICNVPLPKECEMCNVQIPPKIECPTCPVQITNYPPQIICPLPIK